MLSFALSTLTTLFLVVDPPAAAPLFLAMTARDTHDARRRMARRAALITLITLWTFAVAGSALLRVLGISLAAFRMAGGALLFMLAVDMLRAQPSRQRTSPEEEAEGADKPDISVFPLAIPMLAGPGAITTVMILASGARGAERYAILLLAIAVTALAAFLVLHSAAALARRLGQTGLNVMQRVMGLILAAAAMQFLIDGTREALVRSA